MTRSTMVALSLTSAAAMLGLAAWAWSRVPDGQLVPVHWGVVGLPDLAVDKTAALVLVPVATLVMTLVMAHLPRFDPAASGDAGPWRGIRGLWLAALVGLLGLQGVIAAVAMDPFFDAGRALAILCGVSLVLFGNHLPTVRQSWFLGIRTPWTMTSRRAWVQTHRLGGRVFVLVGIGAVASGVVGTGELAPIGPVVIAVLIAWVALTAFSFRVWHTDPDREVT